MNPLFAIGPADGRYATTTEPLRAYLSEGALITYRVKVETEYFLALCKVTGIGIRTLGTDEVKYVSGIAASLGEKDIVEIKEIETKGRGGIPATNHDVKAVEYFVKERFNAGSLADVAEWIHFGLTSEDVNNLAYALMLSDAVQGIILPSLAKLETKLNDLAVRYAALPMLARTHGQPASPTTLGKEFRVFASRLERQTAALRQFKILAKLNGATGNFNAHVAAYPNVDWPGFSTAFIKTLSADRQLEIVPNPVTTQIEPHDTYAELFDLLRRVNTILTDCAADLWRYVSDGWLSQIPKEGEVGSSTMPHKLNPIDFENAEGNFGVANALCEFFSRKLPVSRLQRDLADSTVERNFGTAFAHSLVGYTALHRGLGKIVANDERIAAELAAHPEVITEAVQTILRTTGVAFPYEALKKLTRGKQVTLENIRAFVDSLDVPPNVKERLQKLTPANYIGLAHDIARKGTKKTPLSR